VTRTDLNNLARLSGFEVIRYRTVGYVPWRLAGVGTFLNWVLPAVPWIRSVGFASVITLRPHIASSRRPSLTIIIPARNEKGNIESAVNRIPDLGCKSEIIFVEGHSNDGTWEEIQRVVTAYSSKLDLKALRQEGKGKADAVRLGCAHASSDLLTILDADLTMPPELLGRFYEAYSQGLADFINGTRLVYPMEGDAMRPLNRLGNVFFAKALSSVLGTRLGDSLCGTKLFARHDYSRMKEWRRDFGDFDPFGDFELLFPASELALGVVDIPIRYRARVYGSTNISWFRHGLMLLRMTLFAFLHIKMGKTV
jgi:glycosyltransferase involved in cell wall biosynthesis